MTSSKTYKRLAGHTTDLKYCCHNTAQQIADCCRRSRQVTITWCRNLRPFQRCVQQLKFRQTDKTFTIYSHTGGMADQPELKAGHPPAGKFYPYSLQGLLANSCTFIYGSEGWRHARGYQAQTWGGRPWCLRPEICRCSSRTSVSANSYAISS